MDTKLPFLLGHLGADLPKAGRPISPTRRFLSGIYTSGLINSMSHRPVGLQSTKLF